MEDVATLVRNVEQISSLPTVYTKVTELIDDPKTCSADIGRIIENDQALTSKLLRLANSAFYGFTGSIETVTKAISIIGFKQLRDLVLAISVRSTFGGFEDNSVINMKSFWQHSVACGIASRVLAIYRGKKKAEAYFIAGFLHDFGRLILLENFPDKCREVYNNARDTGRLAVEIEQEVFGFTHSDVGSELVKVWNLPKSLAEAIADHHCPSKSKKHSDITDIVHLADIVVHAFDIGFSGSHFVPAVDTHVWQRTGLKNSILEPAIDKTFEQYEELAAFLTDESIV